MNRSALPLAAVCMPWCAWLWGPASAVVTQDATTGDLLAVEPGNFSHHETNRCDLLLVRQYLDVGQSCSVFHGHSGFLVIGTKVDAPLAHPLNRRWQRFCCWCYRSAAWSRQHKRHQPDNGTPSRCPLQKETLKEETIQQLAHGLAQNKALQVT